MAVVPTEGKFLFQDVPVAIIQTIGEVRKPEDATPPRRSLMPMRRDVDTTPQARSAVCLVLQADREVGVGLAATGEREGRKDRRGREADWIIGRLKTGIIAIPELSLGQVEDLRTAAAEKGVRGAVARRGVEQLEHATRREQRILQERRDGLVPREGVVKAQEVDLHQEHGVRCVDAGDGCRHSAHAVQQSLPLILRLAKILAGVGARLPVVGAVLLLDAREVDGGGDQKTGGPISLSEVSSVVFPFIHRSAEESVEKVQTVFVEEGGVEFTQSLHDARVLRDG
ncbi:hypothetical protein [Microbacterium sp. MM2322]|uniref:hypothetical protein n=1 Tax=Microbacterium sp. MM2322 TaxID=3157631 RepID=UPI0032D5AC77